MKPVPALLPFSWLYGCAIILRNMFFDSGFFHPRRLRVPVISVGNITTGGTGKTPIVELVAATLSAIGLRAAIVSRGYGRKSKGTKEISDGSSLKASVEEAGDEALQIALRVPKAVVVVAEQRVRGAEQALSHPEVNAIVLDDGFQHRALHRNLDIVLIDATQSPFGMSMLPAGHRREPLSALARADAVILTKSEGSSDLERLRGEVRSKSSAKIFTSSHRVVAFRRAKSRFSLDLNTLRGKRVVAFCGIGRPESFRSSLASIGVQVDVFRAFADHHWYTPAELQVLENERARRNADFIVTTEKDCVRISDTGVFEQYPLFYLEIEAEIREREEWKQMIAEAAGKKEGG